MLNSIGVHIASLDQDKFQTQVEKVWNNAIALEDGAKALATWSCDVLAERQDGSLIKSFTVFGADILAIFRPITGDILKLAQSQADGVMKKKGCFPRRIIVVGGFGLNNFLRSELQDRFGEQVVYFTDIKGQLAVKHGAAIHGIAKVANRPVDPTQGPPRVNMRIARQSYGAWMGSGPKDLVKWFINKFDEVDANSQPLITLPRAAFKARDALDRPCVPIYRCRRETATFESINGMKYKNPCQIRCTHPESLGQLEEDVQLRPRLNGRQQVEFDLPERFLTMFVVEKLKLK